jgi:ethanolamine permease
MAMISVIRLRKREPELERPFKAPFFPVAPWLALIIAGISFMAMAIENRKLVGIYLAIMLGSWLLFKAFPRKKTDI